MQSTHGPSEKQVGMLLYLVRKSPMREMLPARIEKRNGVEVDHRFGDLGRWLEGNLNARMASELITLMRRGPFMEAVGWLERAGYPLKAI